MVDQYKVVIGLGKTGLSCAQFLAKQDCRVIVMDSRDNPPGLKDLQTNLPKVPIYLKCDLSFLQVSSFPRKRESNVDFRLCGNETSLTRILNNAEEIIISPGLYLPKLQGISDIELFARNAKAPIVVITGSNGKSTVTELVGLMAQKAGLSVKVGGNLGTPALDLLTSPEPDLYVLELSSFQLERTNSLKAHAAVVLNISPDHMDRYKNIAEYTAAKMRIYNNCKTAVINRDFFTKIPVTKSAAKKLYFSLTAPKENEFGVKDNYLKFGDKKLLPITKLKIIGRHQIANALAALALGKAINLPWQPMLQALQDFSGLPHRCQKIATINNVTWINDSKATNVGAAIASIEGIATNVSGKIILIAGGQDKNADFSLLRDVVKKYVTATILIGDDNTKLTQALNNICELITAESMQHAVAIAKRQAKPNDVVLLAPACASFDWFKNFEHRGEEFIKWVKKG